MRFKIASCIATGIILLNIVSSASVQKNNENELIKELASELSHINGQEISQVFNYKPYYSTGTEDDEEKKNVTKPSTALSWGAGMASGLAITLCSICGVFLTPLTQKPWYKKLLLYLVGAATASLMGNSLFQLLPPAYGVEVNKSNELNIWKSATAYMSFVFFFIIERSLNIIFGGDDEEDSKSEKKSVTKSRAQSRLSVNPARDRAGSTLAGTAIAGAANPAPKSAVAYDDSMTIFEKMKTVKMFAWMLFIGDALENVADGMAMGAGFGQSIALGIGITIAIFSEEFPHKIGDFAIFLNAGMSVKMALVVNVISGATVWIGIVIGLIASDNEEVTMFIFAIAGGVFLYVGLGGLFPEMGEVSEELQEEGYSPWKTLAIELAGLATGLAMMLLLCYFSEDIEHAFE